MRLVHCRRINGVLSFCAIVGFVPLKPVERRSIPAYLNHRRIFTRDGGRWGIGQVHRILTRPAYVGRHEFNKRAKNKTLKPVSEIVTVDVPPLIDQATFDAVQAHLRARNPKVTPARVVSGPTLLTGICFCAGCGGAMTLRTGKGGRYRYYTCSIKARQGETGCKGRSIPMEKLDSQVADHIADRLLQPERLEEMLASILDRRQERAERRREHITELNRRAAEAELRLKRIYDAIEVGVADLDDPALKERVVSLKAIRDQTQADAERATAMLGSSAEITRVLPPSVFGPISSPQSNRHSAHTPAPHVPRVPSLEAFGRRPPCAQLRQ